MNFENALSELKAGKKVGRFIWQCNDMWIHLTPAFYPYKAYLEIRTSDGEIMPWLPGTLDLLASDWILMS